MSKAISTTQPDALTTLLITPETPKNERSRLQQFLRWNDGAPLHLVNLDTYASALQQRLSPASAAAHISTIRAALRKLAKSNPYRDALYAMTPDDVRGADKSAFVNEIVTRLTNAADADNGKVKVVKSRDTADSKHLRLTPAQANMLLEAPGVDTLMGIRDTAIIALMLCTGIREGELCALDTGDLRQTRGDKLALHIRRGKGAVERLVVYGELDWCLAYVDKWVALASIEGALFRGFYKGGKAVRSTRITPDAIQDILNRYPIPVNGVTATVKPHDLRRTYARAQYDAGVDVVAIQQNLGHADLKTTLDYIGALDSDRRAGKNVYRPPHLDALMRLATLAD